jgi:hypothetical protein
MKINFYIWKKSFYENFSTVKLILIAILFLSYSINTNAQSGITVITHGFQPNGGQADLSFLDSYAKAIYEKTNKKASIYINDITTGKWVAAISNNKNDKNEEIILLYTWAI